MQKTMKIEGMMCGHCEATVKKTLEAIQGVEEAVVSHETGTAVVTLSGDVSSDILKEAVEVKRLRCSCYWKNKKEEKVGYERPG